MTIFKTKVTTFQTKEGQIIYRSLNREYSAERAIRKAAQQGCDSLIAIDPTGQKWDYSFLLTRYYEKHSLTPAA